MNAKPKWYNGVKYRSGLEADCAKLLDDFNIAFQYESFKLELLPKFIYRGKTYQPWTYKPDFVIFNDVILEVKGYKNADNYVNKRKMILKHLLDNNLPYKFYEIYSDSHLRAVLNKYTSSGDFDNAYAEYDKVLEEKRKLKKLKKKDKRKL